MYPLDQLETDKIRNIYLYVADDVRYDFLPDEIATRGVGIKLISDGIHSPTSFSSIVTGLHYPQHGVNDFSRRVPEEAPNLLHNSSHTTSFCNTINHPPFNTNPSTESILVDTLRTEDAPSDTIETASPPFVVVERGRGGHAPYGDFEGNGTEYFCSRGDTPRHQIVDEYEQGVLRDVDWFQSQLNTLEGRGLMDETLVIYASDHGELLGEGGDFGHNGALHRKLIEVPCVFIHPSLPTVAVQQKIIRHVDLLPTIQAAANVTIPSEFDTAGVNLLEEQPPNFGTSYHLTRKFTESPLPTMSIEYKSVWDATGGYIIPTSRRTDRAAAGLWMLLRGPKAKLRRKQPGDLMTGLLKRAHKSGVPTFSHSTATDILTDIERTDRPSSSDELLQVQTERLKELGYLE